MTREEIDKLLFQGEFPEPTRERKLVETHISWVILCDEFVYKIKKPIKYSFLDFSTLKLRKHFCERELELNQRFSKDIYLAVLPIYELQGELSIGANEGTVIDYTVKMHKLDPEKQMDVLISKNMVTPLDIKNLAECIANFHKGTTIIYEKEVHEVRDKFNDLVAGKEFLSKNLDLDVDHIISHSIDFSNTFLDKNKNLLESRLSSGFFRDCHGDLHTRNIFLLPAPQPFDCIEFNDSYREIDILNEIAFLCMDLDALGRKDLSELFIDSYNLLLPAIGTEEERKLFIYYKCYRANVRAKVNYLRALSTPNDTDRKKVLSEVKKYMMLMESYIKSLDML